MQRRQIIIAIIATIALSALIGLGCSESSQAPAGDGGGDLLPHCGTTELPCPFSCKLPCANRMAEAAAACVVTLEGQLDATRQRCSFDDGTEVRFAGPLPASGDLSRANLELELWRDGSLCLGVRRQLGQPATFEVWTGDARRYRQSVWTAAPTPDAGATDAGPADARADDGGPPDAARDATSADSGQDGAARAADRGAAPARLEVVCEERLHLGEGEALCADCPEQRCEALPLMALAVELTPSLSVSLRGGRQSTPLFTCR